MAATEELQDVRLGPIQVLIGSEGAVYFHADTLIRWLRKPGIIAESVADSLSVVQAETTALADHGDLPYGADLRTDYRLTDRPKRS